MKRKALFPRITDSQKNMEKEPPLSSDNQIQHPGFLLMKFGTEEHLNDLRDRGAMFLNTWEYFKGLEGDTARGDPLEGTLFMFQGPQVQLSIQKGQEGEFMPLTGLTGQLKVSSRSMDLYNIFCMFAFTEQQLTEFDVRRFEGFGGHVAVCVDSGEFLKRVAKALNDRGLPAKQNVVDYKDIEEVNGKFGPFAKSKIYSYQSEFRITVKTGLKAPLRLEIGDLTDILDVYKWDELPPNDWFKRVFEDK